MTSGTFACPCGELTDIRHDEDGDYVDCECGNFGYVR